ncbi:TPA: cytochrome d ubiquinol oxidase subunit II [Burkholderia vietnamiensis]|uniref:cytochrome d ubiquinol oxidase subunit II n=1 Tax=Burkholderia vietnamiensis TaxID=60552 RepID=UPI00159482A8|nr:cytochrome d ubiquinol oxidase subunit II [Burkholderia vietnamiensis]HDR9009496.1 cytochrome d ubiquinol oxidase subunit II [Burkholderia vietnamiensis]HDR9015721.1 cytochrome d ubiquinol oxidase subunit II [Burkholderia vietnamiensis]
MTGLDLVPLWAGVLALSVLMYVLLDEAERDVMIASVSPVWDFDETWLVLGGTLLLAACPGAFSVVVPGVYFPVLLMLLGLLFRGVTGARKRLWSGAFAYGSLVATAAQGAVLGMFVQGFKVVDGRFAGTSWDWVAPFPLMTAAGLVAGYLLLGSTWLVMKGEGPLRAAAQRSARHALVGVIVFIVVVSVWTPLADRGIAARWFAWPNLLVFSPVPVLTAWLAWLAARALRRGRDVLPFVASIGLFFLGFSGLTISLWPHVAPPSVTLWSAASAQVSQEFLMIGTAFMLPVLLLYVCWSYWVFRGKVRGDVGYEHM